MYSDLSPIVPIHRRLLLAVLLFLERVLLLLAPIVNRKRDWERRKGKRLPPQSPAVTASLIRGAGKVLFKGDAVAFPIRRQRESFFCGILFNLNLAENTGIFDCNGRPALNMYRFIFTAA